MEEISKTFVRVSVGDSLPRNFKPDSYFKRIKLFRDVRYMVIINEKIKEINKKEKHFKDNKIKLNDAKPMTAEEFNKSHKKRF